MANFAEKLKLLERKKQEYRERLAALPEKQQKAVEDEVWHQASRLSASIGFETAQKPEVRSAQFGLEKAFETVRNLEKNEEITPALLMDLHQFVLGDEDPLNAGQYRRMSARWNNSTMIMSNWASIPTLVNRLCDNINSNGDMGFYTPEQRHPALKGLSHHPVIRAIETCYSTVVTHPFADANKRMARLNTALVLSRANYIPMAIYDKRSFVENVEDYCQTHQPHNFVRMMLTQMDHTYDQAFVSLKLRERD